MNKIKEFLKRHAFLVVIIVALVVAAGNYVLSLEKDKIDNNLINVPVAISSLNQNTLITEDKLTEIAINKAYLPSNVIIDKEAIVGKYIAGNCTVPANGFFYDELVTDAKSAFGTAYSNLEKGESAYSIALDSGSEQYGRANLLKAGEYINVYYFEEYTNNEGFKEYLAGQLAENIRIVDVVSNDSKQDYVVLALKEEQIADFILAEQYGSLVPLVNYSSNGVDMKKTEFYDVASMHNYLKAKSTILTKAGEIAEEIYGEEGQVE